MKQLKFNFFHPPNHDPSQVVVPQNVKKVIPAGYGYTAGHLAHDLVAALEVPPPEMNSLKEVAGAWMHKSIYDPGKKAYGPLQAKALAVDYYKFFHRFKRSQLKTLLLEYTGGDPVAAANVFLQLLDWHLVKSGGEWENLPNALNKMLALDLSDLPDLLKIPFAPPHEGGKGAGQAHCELITRALRIAELVKKLRLRYESYSKRSFSREEVPYPDDIDVITLRSYSLSDISRITTSDLAEPDDMFIYKFATRSVKQVIYYHPQPEPPRHIAMLIDVSGSMNYVLGQYTKLEFAFASAVALLESALRGGHKVSLVRFDAEPFPPIEGTPAEVVRELLKGEASGGGTDIDAALRYAVEELKAEEIILITDGEDRVEYKVPASIPLTVYFAGGRNEALERQARLFQRVDEMKEVKE